MKKIWLSLLVILFCLFPLYSLSSVQQDYCSIPPFISAQAPPLVMLVMGRNHKLYYEVYNDASDIDGDGQLDVGYKHSIDYYGYFDPYKCYLYDGSKFIPTRHTNNKYCGEEDEWSGNFLNWLSMSRMDVLRKALYGGYRSTDTASETVLEGVFIPQDAHSWGKEYVGEDTRLLTPFDPPQGGKRHLFCVTSLSDGEPHRIRVLLNNSHRIWEWVSKERPVCDNSLGTPAHEYFVRVKVCDPSVCIEDNCKQYPNGNYKPIGLLQKYGEGGNKVCSKSLNPCSTDADCGGEGLCTNLASIYFGLITGSYTKNLSGGVLRKQIWSINDEIDPNTGEFNTTIGDKGSIIQTINRLRTVGFRYSDYSYQGSYTCGWITTRPLQEGECRMWGNPIGEMMYEAERYFAGKGSPTSDFTYSSSQDTGLDLPKPDWNDPYAIFPWCSKPSIIVISDINPSYDSDKVPGSDFNSYSGDLPDLNVKELAKTIGDEESITNTSHFIGQSGGENDFICSAKDISNLGSVRGLCPEEPTKQGSYYSAALAYYAKTQFKDKLNRENITTYTVALSSPIPRIKMQVGSHIVTLVPIGKSVSGCLGIYNSCAHKCTLTYDYNKGLVISNCSNNSYCSSNQIVDFYVTQITSTHGQFRINFEDVEQGADHDMDAIVTYEYEVIDNSHVKVKLSSDYAAGCIDQVMGFAISGTTEDGVYLPVRDKDSGACDGNTPSVVCNMPLVWEKTFTVSSGSTATLLKNPLWYAAKWGGFDDINGNNKPDLQSEWDQDSDGFPDTYFFVSDPSQIETTLNKVFADILSKTASATSASLLTKKNKVGKNLIQAVFYPKKQFPLNELNWLGYLYNYWFYFNLTYSNIREDTISNKALDICSSGTEGGDLILDFLIDNSTGNLNIKAYKSTCDGSNSSLYTTYMSLDELTPVWEAGSKLAQKNATTRKIYTYVNATEPNNPQQLIELKALNSTYSYLFGDEDKDEIIDNESNSNGTLIYNPISYENLIKYIYGTDISGFRSRKIDGTNTWKLGDIIYSTPKIVDYDDYSIVYVGANDGMLHAFRLGKLRYDGLDAYQDIKLCNDKSSECKTDKLGEELWSYIPKNSLPYLRALTDTKYCHLYYVDLMPYIIEIDTNNDKKIDKKILIGGMRLGGGVGCSGTNCVNPPLDTCPSPSNYNPATNNCIGLSSYFALDITNSTSPKFLWEFTDPELGFTYSGPAFIKKDNNYYIMFASGPTNYRGESDQDLKLFVLQLNSDPTLDNFLTISSVTKIDNSVSSTLSSFNKSFGGRLFTQGIDYNNDGNTDMVFLGTTRQSGSTFQGNVLGVKIDDSDPENWDIIKVFNSSIKPITAKIEYSKCFDMNYIYFGTGRYFYPNDDPGQNQNDQEILYGVRIDGCLTGGNCNINNAHSASEACDHLDDNNGTVSWYQKLDPKEDQYFKERMIADPTVTDLDVIFFSTTQPTTDVCSFGGRSRMWQLNCATGEDLSNQNCPGYKVDTNRTKGKLFLQLSQGNIEQFTVGTGPTTSFTGPVTPWRPGITPESPTPFISPDISGSGKILLWIEK